MVSLVFGITINLNLLCLFRFVSCLFGFLWICEFSLFGLLLISCLFMLLCLISFYS